MGVSLKQTKNSVILPTFGDHDRSLLMQTGVQRLGILAGGGNLPREVAEYATASGHEVHIVAIDGEADADFSDFSVARVNLGAIGKMVASFKANDISDLIIVGSVTRPNLREIKPDFGFFRSLPKIIQIIAAGGDDSTLRKVIDFFESHGFRVCGVPEVAPGLLIGTGPFGALVASNQDKSDIAIGFDIVRRLGPFDIGQGVVVNNGVVEAIEGAEGTDKMLERVALMRVTKFAKLQRGVLIKRPKPMQEMRVDLPTIGPDTAMLASRAGLSGIAVLENGAIAIRRFDLIACADESELFIEGCGETDDEQKHKASFDGDISFVQLGNTKMSRREETDLHKAVGVLEAIAPYEIGGAVAVVRNHVLAIEIGEGLEVFMERVKSLRQWGGKIVRDRVGVVIFGSAEPFGTRLVSVVADSGLNGVIVASDGFSKQEWSTAIVNADSRKLFIGALTIARIDS